MEDSLFQRRAEAAMEHLYKRLASAAEDHDFEPGFQAGALTVEFEDPPARFVVSPNSPVRQIWVSANVKSFKLDWSDAAGTFVFPATGQDLAALLGEQVSRHLGGEVKL